MKFAEKNDNGIELHLTAEEREVMFDALRHYSAYGKNESHIIEQIPTVCEIMNVLHLPEFDSVKNGG